MWTAWHLITWYIDTKSYFAYPFPDNCLHWEGNRMSQKLVTYAIYRIACFKGIMLEYRPSLLSIATGSRSHSGGGSLTKSNVSVIILPLSWTWDHRLCPFYRHLNVTKLCNSLCCIRRSISKYLRALKVSFFVWIYTNTCLAKYTFEIPIKLYQLYNEIWYNLCTNS